MMIGTDVQNYFGPKLKVICDKFNIQFNETALLKKNQTREQLLALVAKDVSVLDKIFFVQVKDPFQHPIKDLDEQKELNNKDANKNKKIGAIINGLIQEGLMEEAVAMYLYRKKMKAINAFIRRLKALKEAERYAEQVFIFETERMQLQEQMQMAMEAELSRLDKKHDDIFDSIQSHIQAIKEIDERISMLFEKENILLAEFGNDLGDSLEEALPEISREKRQEFGNALLREMRECDREIIHLECQLEHEKKQMAAHEANLNSENEKVNQLINSVVNHPEFARPAAATPAITAHYESTNLKKMLSDPAQRQKLENAQKNDNVLQLFDQISAHDGKCQKIAAAATKIEQKIGAHATEIEQYKVKRDKLPEQLFDNLLASSYFSTEKIEEVKSALLPNIQEKVKAMRNDERLAANAALLRNEISAKLTYVADIDAGLTKMKEMIPMHENIANHRSKQQQEEASLLKTLVNPSYPLKLESKKQQISQVDDFLDSLISQPLNKPKSAYPAFT